MEKKVTVRKDLCVGCGLCTGISNVLIIGDDGLAEATTELLEESQVAEVEEAANACPVSAIEVE
ncbi:MAG: ferredoxin [Erysipelotrichaceae bacterium]|nr:ferredoxin [Erysipelotrichaceae bacterium]